MPTDGLVFVFLGIPASRSEFDGPLKDGQTYSQLQGKPFTITVNSTDPMWFYCATPSHCQLGMVVRQTDGLKRDLV